MVEAPEGEIGTARFQQVSPSIAEQARATRVRFLAPQQMKTHTLRFRAVDRDIFDEIRNGLKSVETRAATERYRDIKKGDELVIKCGTARLVKRVKRVRHFASIGSMFNAIPFKKIMPSARNPTEAREAYYGYPGYKDKIRKNGIVALELE